MKLKAIPFELKMALDGENGGDIYKENAELGLCLQIHTPRENHQWGKEQRYIMFAGEEQFYHLNDDAERKEFIERFATLHPECVDEG